MPFRLNPCFRLVVPIGAIALTLITLASPVGAEPNRVGLMADLGVPDGMVGAIVFRAHPHLRLHAGVGHNSVSPGLRAGVHVQAFDSALSPYLAVEAGHFFMGDASGFVQSTAESLGLDDAELDTIGYTYGNAHIGLQLGSKSAAFYLQGGVSWLRARATLHESRTIDMQVDGLPPGAPASEPTVDVVGKSSLGFFTPSARLGLITYF